MGLFGGNKKRFVDTQVLRVVEDEYLPTPLKTAMFESIIDKDGDIGVSLKNAALHGPGRGFEKMYRYAERGDYYYGLPNARLLSSDDATEAARTVIETQLEPDTEVDIEYVHYRPVNKHHKAWEHLSQSLGYNPSTNEIEGLTPVYANDKEKEGRYLTKIVAVHNGSPEDRIDPQSLGTWGRGSARHAAYTPAYIGGEGFQTIGEVNPAEESGAADPHGYYYRVGPNEVESAEIYYRWKEKDITYHEDGSIKSIDRTLRESSIVVDLSDVDIEAEVYQAKYSYWYEPNRRELLRGDKARTIEKYWSYVPGTGTYPELDAVFAIQTPLTRTPGTYFPFAIFRSDHEDKTIYGSENPGFQSTRKLLEYINIDFAELGQAMHDKENEGIDDVRQAVMMMAIPLNSQHEIEMEYLFEYFRSISNQLLEKDPDANKKSVEELLGRTGGAKETSYALEISDSDFNLIISFDNIKRRLVTLDTDLGPVGTITNEVAENEDGLVFDSEDKATQQIPKTRTLRKQLIEVSDSKPGLIEEIVIENPVFKTTVKRLRKKDLIVEGGVDDERLLIPIDKEIAKEISYFDREILYLRSLHFVLNSYVEQKEKWYESGIFKVIMVIVSIAIAWFSGGWGAKIALALASTTAVVTAVAFVLLKFIVTFFLAGMVFEYAFKFVVETIGMDAAFWLAVVATAMGGYKAFSNIAQGTEAMSKTVMNYLKAAAGLHSGISSNIAEEMENLKLEHEAYVKKQEEKLEELEELKQELISPVDIDPLYFVRRKEPFVLFGEPASAYYERTIHSGNVGIQAIDEIHNYVEHALTLPRSSINTPQFGA